MFKDKVFNISFLISFGWHIFCIFAVVLVITPKGFTFNKFPTVSFLGPILEKDTFQSGYNLKPVLMSTPYKEDFAFDEHVFSQNYCNIDAYVLMDKGVYGTQLSQPQMQKQVPDFVKERFSQPTTPSGGDTASENINFFKDFEIEGPLSSRRVIYSPRLPRLPKPLLDSESIFCIELEVFVSSNGIVQRVNRLTTTGYPIVDLSAMRYARGIIFQPIPESAIEEGKISIVLDLR